MISPVIKTLVMTCAIAVAAVAGYWTQQRGLPVASKAIEVMGPVFPGGKVVVRWQVYRTMACRVGRQDLIIDINSLRWVVASQTFEGPPGPLGFDTYMTATPVPADLPIGNALLRVILNYECNPIHRFWPIVDRTPNIPIVILPGPGGR
jgi:hypothetical protein